MLNRAEDYLFVAPDALKRVAVKGKPYPTREQKLVPLGEDVAFLHEALRERLALSGRFSTNRDRFYKEKLSQEVAVWAGKSPGALMSQGFVNDTEAVLQEVFADKINAHQAVVVHEYGGTSSGDETIEVRPLRPLSQDEPVVARSRLRAGAGGAEPGEEPSNSYVYDDFHNAIIDNVGLYYGWEHAFESHFVIPAGFPGYYKDWDEDQTVIAFKSLGGVRPWLSDALWTAIGAENVAPPPGFIPEFLSRLEYYPDTTFGFSRESGWYMRSLFDAESPANPGDGAWDGYRPELYYTNKPAGCPQKVWDTFGTLRHYLFRVSLFYTDGYWACGEPKVYDVAPDGTGQYVKPADCPYIVWSKARSVEKDGVTYKRLYKLGGSYDGVQESVVGWAAEPGTAEEQGA